MHDQDDFLCQTPLIKAAADDNGEGQALSLLQSGADPHPVDLEGQSAFHRACDAGHRVLVSTLLDQGVDINQKANGGITPLMLAASSRKGGDVVHLLLERGANVSQCDDKGQTVLHYAVRYVCQEEVIVAVIRAGVPIDHQDAKGYSALIRAAEYRGEKDEAIALLLLEKGADPHLVDWMGKSALHWALFSRQHTLVAALLERGAAIDQQDRGGVSPLMESIWFGDSTLFLLEKGANPNQLDARGQSALHRAAQYNKPSLVATLLAKGADPNKVDGEGHTAYDIAKSAGYQEVIDCLQQDPNTRKNK